MVRRYQEMDEDSYDDYARYQQAPRKRPQNTSGRYEMARPTLRSLQSTQKGKIITIYTNGEKYIHDKPITLSFRVKAYPQLTSLLDDIARRKDHINKTTVKFLFKWPSGEEVVSVHEITENEESSIYVCSDKRSLYKKFSYGGIAYGATSAGGSSKYSRNSHDSRNQVRSEKVSPVAMRSQGSMGGRGQPINVTVISNTNRNSRQSLFLDPRSNQPFEAILQSVTEMLDLDYPPCKALYSVRPPYKKAESISSFNRIVSQYGDTFWACGKEGEPIEKTEKSRDSSPMRNGHGHHKGKNGTPKQNGYHDHGGDREKFEDSHGREYQRYHSQSHDEQYDDNDADDYDYHSPTRGSPPRRQSPARKQPTQQRSHRYDDEDNKSPTRHDNKRTSNPQQKSNRHDYHGEDDRYNQPTHRSNGKAKSPPPTHRNANDDDDDDRRHPPTDRSRKSNNRSPPPKKYESDDESPVRNGRKPDGADSDDDDDEEKRRKREANHPSEEEMSERVAEVEKVKDDLDKDVDY